MDKQESSAVFRSRYAGGGLLVLCLVIIALALVARRPVPPVPQSTLASADGWADESRCAECHDEAEHFWQTGHAQTLRPAASPQSLELLATLNEAAGLAAEQTAVRATADGVVAVTRVDDRDTAVQLDWCFGSGDHAATWVSTVAGSSGAKDLLEFRWSWYSGGVVAVTPGQPESPHPGRYGKLGVWFDAPKAYRCFSCHASVLPVHDGVIAEAHIKAGVTCQRCHGPRQAHVASEGQAGHSRWPTQDRLESVQRCAQCHRRADELAPEEISTDNLALVRFQPAGLVQSPCFQKSSMDCMTCHDPHLPMEMQDSRGIWQCVQCHNPDEDDHVLCGAGNLDRCLECHMPKVKMDAPVSFTDHWIRVRQSDDE